MIKGRRESIGVWIRIEDGHVSRGRDVEDVVCVEAVSTMYIVASSGWESMGL